VRTTLFDRRSPRHRWLLPMTLGLALVPCVLLIGSAYRLMEWDAERQLRSIEARRGQAADLAAAALAQRLAQSEQALAVGPGSLASRERDHRRFSEIMPLVTPEGRRGNMVALSPDGATIYASQTDPSNVVRLVAFDVATRQSRVIFEPPTRQGQVNLTINPAGTVLAGSQGLPGGRAQLFTVGVDGLGYREVYGPFATVHNWDLHAWTPDSSAIVFVEGQQAGEWQLMRVPATGGAATPTGLSYAGLTQSQPELRLQQPYRMTLMPDGRTVVLGARTMPTTELRMFDNVMAFIDAKR
jgi:hypothetical protein